MTDEDLSRDVFARFKEAASKQASGKIEEAIYIYNDIISSNIEVEKAKNNLSIAIIQYLNQGIKFYNEDCFDDAESVFQKVVEFDNENSQALMLLGVAKLSKRKFTESLRILVKSMSLNPASEKCKTYLQNSIHITFNAAMDLYKDSDFANAAALLNAVLESRPKLHISVEESDLLFRQCQATATQLYNRKLYQEAAKLITNILNNYLSAEALHIAGLIAADQNQHSIAINFFENAIAHSSSNSIINVSMGKSLYALGRHDEGEKSFLMSLEQDKDYKRQKNDVIEKINHYAHFGKASKNRSLIFCTSYINSKQSWDERYNVWLEYYRNSMLARHKICMIDDGGSYDPGCNNMIFHRFQERLGRKSEINFPGWWRSFLFSVELAKREGCNKIIHIESDAFLLSNRIMIYIEAIKSGWTSFWCRRWQMPESAIQVICEDNFEKMLEIAENNLDGEFFLKSAESLLPFTDTIKFFNGDRYGEYIDYIPDNADYVCQTIGKILRNNIIIQQNNY